MPIGMRRPLMFLVAATVVAALSASAIAASQEVAADTRSEPAKTAKPDGAAAVDMTLEQFLDRVMMAESSGQDELRNPRSTAVGPFQLLEGLFLELVERHFAGETAHLTVAQILALRTDRAFARRAAAAFTQDNATHLAREGLSTTFQNLRLAYFAGPAGAVRILRADPAAKISSLLSTAAIRANPFLRGLTAADLIAKSARDIAADAGATAGVTPTDAAPSKAVGPRIKVRCNLGLSSCQKWLALRTAKLRRQQARLSGARGVAAD